MLPEGYSRLVCLFIFLTCCNASSRPSSSWSSARAGTLLDDAGDAGLVALDLVQGLSKVRLQGI